MQDSKKTKSQLIEELNLLRDQNKRINPGKGEQELERKNIELNSFINNIPDLAWIKDMESQFIAVNKAFADAVEMAPELLINQTCEVCFGEELAKKFKEDDQKVMKKGEQTIFEEKIVDSQNREIWLETIKSPIFDGLGNCVGTVGIARDITKRKRVERELEKAYDQSEVGVKERTAELTAVNKQLMTEIAERKRVEKELREGEERYRALFERSLEGVYVHDLEGNFIDANTTALNMLGYDKEEIKNLTFLSLIGEDQLPTAIEGIQEILATGHHKQPYEFRLKRKDGGEILVEAKAFSILREGEIHSILGIARDITDQKLAEEEREKLRGQLNQAQKMEAVGRLAGGVAHDFNNLLTAIIGYSEMIKSSLDPNDILYSDVMEIMKAAESASRLTVQLLAFSRKQIISPKVININKSVEHSRKMLTRLIEEDIDLMFIPGKDLWRTRFDYGQFDQVLVNLVVNARDAMPNGGKLTIETANVTFDDEYCISHPVTKPGEYVMLAVSDDGCGMEKEVLDNIFEPFFTTKAINKGTGLGMSTVYGIVRQHDGFVYIYSEPGHGTVVSIYLRRIEAKTDVIERPVADAPIGGSETVLLAEDQDIVRKLAKRMLEENGYHVLAANDGGSAYQKCKKYEGDIHLLLTDVVMPKMNGKELYDQVSSARPEIRVLYMSGFTETAIAHRGVLDEGTAFIQKPFKVYDLLRKVREVLDA